ncbi:MAG: sulfite oxidase [Acidobacteria bacterium]|nr:sulfite oxidase [Acidobacteriota bacterium]
MKTRRHFLKNASLLGSEAMVGGPLLSWSAGQLSTAGAAPRIAGKDRMIVHSERFLDLEMPPEFAVAWLTPVEHFFVRNHMFEPAKINLSEWKLTIQGEVRKPLTLTVRDLLGLEQHSVTNALECAGNGRAFYRPQLPGVQWQRGAVGNARFTGPRLARLLERAGVSAAAKHVMFRGLDEVPGNVPPFIRSIPIEKASDPDTLIALKMNGAPLAAHHGFPARALVPGWIGSASSKWLTEIKVLPKEFEGNFMKPGYRYPNQPVSPGAAVNPDDMHPLTALAVKSIIAVPSDGETIRSRRPRRIQGAAWAGEADIVKVEVSTDDGGSWNAAELGKEHAPYAWRLWSYLWRPAASAEHVILSRATDSQGRVQPDNPQWNPSGYLYNAVDRVKVHVEA